MGTQDAGSSIDRFWADHLGVPESSLSIPGVSVTRHARLADYSGLWIFGRDAA